MILELQKKGKNYEKDIKKSEADVDKAKKECVDAVGKASELCEENTLVEFRPFVLRVFSENLHQINSICLGRKQQFAATI